MLTVSVVIVALMGLQYFAVVPTSDAGASSAHGPAAVTVTASAAQPAAPSGTSLPGQTTAGEARINPVALSESTGAKVARQAAAAAAALSSRGAGGSAAPSTLGGIRASSVMAAGAHPGGTGFDYGFLIGTVVDSRLPHLAISGATVAAEPLVGFCPSIGCIANQTGSTGQFRVAAAVGENEILFYDSYYMTNRTWAYVTLGSIIDLGTINLVADGYVTGHLVGSDPAHEPVSAINITGTTRDGAFTASPSAHSNSVGAFTVAVPPVPSEISFVPIFQFSAYEANYTFVNVSAGKTLNLGTIYMQRDTLVSLNLIDSITKAPLPAPAAVTFCSKVTGACGAQGPASDPYVVGEAPVGPDTAKIQADGYVDNTTSLGWVPSMRPGSAAIPMGTVEMVPNGAITFWANISGIPAPYGGTPPTSIWPVPTFMSVYVSACSEDAIEYSFLTTTLNLSSTGCSTGCTSPGVESIMAGIPLRDYITVTPATENQCSFSPTWPIPPDLPVIANYAWVNVTPDYATNAGGIDLLPGTYIEGQVLPAAQVGWNVIACSTDEPNICGEGVYADQAYDDNFDNFVPTACPQIGSPTAGTTFCVPAPPGPVKISVTSPNASSNFTWANNPPLHWNTLPLPLSTASLNRVQSINLTSAKVTGRVLEARSLTPVAGLPAVEICPAGTPSASVGCETGAPNSTGFFKAWAPIGWDKVTASAPEYLSNGTWLYVAKSNSTGTILITPFGFVEGQVVDPSGNGILEATVKLCPVSSPSSCAPIGSDGLASTDGFYYGATAAGSLPMGSYEVLASAPGYSSDWTWVNVTTPGQNFTAPTIILHPLAGSPLAGPGGVPASPSPGAHGASSGGGPVGEWVTGTVVDLDQGSPLTIATVIATPLSGGNPSVISSIRGTGGEFNDSLPVGAYDIGFSQQGFYSTSAFLNVSGNASSLDVGTVSLEPFPTATGRVVIDPTSWREGVSYGMGLGPGPANVEACTSDSSICGPTATVDSGGFFNISAPTGTYDVLFASGQGTGPGTYPGGFVSNSSFINASNISVPDQKTTIIGLSIFGIVTGQVLDATSGGSQPVRFDTITVDSDHPIDATQAETLTADGNFAVIFPESEQLNLTVGGLGAWIPINVTIPTTIVSTDGIPNLYLFPGGLAALGARFSLQHYGWIDVRVTNARNGQPVPYATVSAQETGVLWGLPAIFESSAVANGVGYLNLTAPPSIPSTQRLAVNVSAPDYLYHNLTLTVNSSRTTFINGTTPFNMNGIRLSPWGWITGQVLDAASGRALSGVAVTVNDPASQSGATGVTTNGLGVYLTDAPVSKADAVSLSIHGYSSNLSRYNVTSGAWIVAASVHLTGDGVVEGRVVSFPGGVVVSGATVSVCPKAQPNCPNQVTTNATGIFAIAAAPGLDSVAVAAAGFVTNTPQFVVVQSDTWVWAGTVTVDEFADVVGTVLGLPDGLSLTGANASLCGLPSSGLGAGVCFVTVRTAADGSFTLQAPAGLYVLDVNATFYNDSYLTVSIAPGESLSVGTVFIQEFGTGVGVVDNSVSGSAVAGATITACEQWGAGACTTPTTTGSDGRFVVSGPAGAYLLQVSAAGYQSSFVAVRLTSATTIVISTIPLIAIGPDDSYTVWGTVRSASTTQPLPGAVVTASGSFSGYVGLNGQFSFMLPWGSYMLSASLAGYQEESQAVTVHGPLSNVAFLLTTETYAVTGVARDGLSGQALSGVEITENGVALGAVTSANGAFDLSLTNGTHSLMAQVVGTSSGYVSVPFSLVVQGAGVVHDLSIYPPSISVDGIVASALSGMPISGATVTVSGTVSTENLPWTDTTTSGPDGRFVALAYPGAYTVGASQRGYSSASISLHVYATGTAPVTVDLSPISTAAAAGPTTGVLLHVAAGVGGAAVLAGVCVFWARRPRSVPTGTPGSATGISGQP